ncbi:BNR repeat domain protein [Minicystis rosea]|nr:BNR repeat domain protein [Minicystis rosea]
MRARSLRLLFTLLSSIPLAACGPEISVEPTSTSPTPPPPTSPTPPPPTPLPDPGTRLSQAAPMCIKHPSGTVTCHLPLSNPELATELSGVFDAVEVVQALEQGCLRHATGRVSCWGWSHHGQLGLAVDIEEHSDVPVELPEVEVVKLASSHHSVCGIRPSGQAICWGGAYDGPIGAPEPGQTQAPLDVLGVPDAVDIAASINRVCAVRASGAVSCWKDHEAPVAIEGISGAVKVSVSTAQVCALRGNGTVICWREDIGTVVPALEDVVQLSGALGVATTCARTAAGGVACWGVGASQYDAPLVLDIADAVDVSAASSGACAVRSDGTIACWDEAGTPVPFPLQSF